MATATVGHEERHQRAHPFHVGVIEDRAAIALAAHQPGSRQDREVRRKRIRWASDRLGKCTRRDPAGLSLHEQTKNREPRRLTQSGESGQGVRR